MTVIADPPTVPDDSRARKAVGILFWAQSVLGSQMPIHFVLGGLVGQMLAADPAFATLPITMTVLGSMLTAPGMSLLMDRLGRRQGFILGATAGSVAAGLATFAIVDQNFVLFLAASLIMGIYMSAHGFYRFAAADLASPSFRPKAISWVMAGGLVSAIIGPQMAKEFESYLAPIPFAGAYLSIVGLNLVGIVPVLYLDIPRRSREERLSAGGRRLGEILRNRTVVVAMLCAMVSYALMNLVMTSTPLAMLGCGFGVGDTADVVMIHILAMFGPSFFTGHLIARFGAPRIIAAGLATLALCALVAMSGITFVHFGLALALLGVGWNFGFIGATALLTSAHSDAERARVQGLNDFLVFGLVTVASFGSGALMASIGWNAVNAAILPTVAVAAVALVWLVLQDRRASA